jgi:hypothetical protein
VTQRLLLLFPQSYRKKGRLGEIADRPLLRAGGEQQEIARFRTGTQRVWHCGSRTSGLPRQFSRLSPATCPPLTCRLRLSFAASLVLVHGLRGGNVAKALCVCFVRVLLRAVSKYEWHERCARTMFSQGDQANTVNLPSCEATSATASCWSRVNCAAERWRVPPSWDGSTISARAPRSALS